MSGGRAGGGVEVVDGVLTTVVTYTDICLCNKIFSRGVAPSFEDERYSI